MVIKSKHDHISEREGSSKASGPLGILFFGSEAAWEAIHSFYSVGVIRTLTPQLQPQANKIPETDV